MIKMVMVVLGGDHGDHGGHGGHCGGHGDVQAGFCDLSF